MKKVKSFRIVSSRTSYQRLQLLGLVRSKCEGNLVNRRKGNHRDEHVLIERPGWDTEESLPILSRIPTSTSTGNRLEKSLGCYMPNWESMGTASIFATRPRGSPAPSRFHARVCGLNPWNSENVSVQGEWHGSCLAQWVVSLILHHLLVYGEVIDFARLRNGKVVGVSSFPRLIYAVAPRSVVHEVLVADIAEAFMSVVEPLGRDVKAIGRHHRIAA